MIDPDGLVSEKDERQLAALPAMTQVFARSARDEVRRLIGTSDALFDASAPYYQLPAGAAGLAPATDALPLD